eukprot:CAMPEP_0204010038 /NCGR_PEP_ID=MMETSP0360-20130528/22265_1 /ASSEMBLY_ACC=CAM_ASM_000342 /TAXON_ID=268821 /ORGANISM="Scrippsiella Hangoei, Strain SHTV-5" /LENGTH=96 /DNA_ID=CAMNT_0050952459 /DNA_START=91 /DNA_END=377 /DNA_ORIENTATION=-
MAQMFQGPPCVDGVRQAADHVVSHRDVPGCGALPALAASLCALLRSVHDDVRKYQVVRGLKALLPAAEAVGAENGNLQAQAAAELGIKVPDRRHDG